MKQGNPHLNDDQFAALMSGSELPPEAEDHLSECAACQLEVAEFRSSLDSFNTVSLAWSEAQPSRSLRSVAAASRKWPVLAVPGLSFAAVLVIAATASIIMHGNHTDARMHVPVIQEDSASQIEQDNRLLLAIDQATSLNIVSPEEEYGFHAVNRAGTIRTQERRSND